LVFRGTLLKIACPFGMEGWPTSQDVLFLEEYRRWHCRAKHEAPQFTLKTGTIMEDSPIGQGHG
jgi:hypothetical protein